MRPSLRGFLLGPIGLAPAAGCIETINTVLWIEGVTLDRVVVAVVVVVVVVEVVEVVYGNKWALKTGPNDLLQ